MSQHTCDTTFTTVKGETVSVEILMGWDRLLQQFFLVVEVVDMDVDIDFSDLPVTLRETSLPDEGIIYSNLCDYTTNKDLPYFTNKLKELGISLPNGMLDEVIVDQANNVGNREMKHYFK